MVSFSWLILITPDARGETKPAACPSSLWRPLWIKDHPNRFDGDLERLLHRSVQAALRMGPLPVRTVSSAGKTDPHDPILRASRRAFQDADNASLLAIAWRSLGTPKLFERVREILLAWAHVNEPTGHPIDETRLRGLLIAYDLVRCTLPDKDKEPIVRWLRDMKRKKEQWRFGPKSSMNNHKTHHLMMLLMLDKMLGDKEDYIRDIRKTADHLHVNLDAKTGESVDFRERHALYYHAYNLEAWLEIALLTNRFREPVIKAFAFMKGQIESGNVHSEFEGSTAPIDAIRGKAGFGYGVGKKRFDINKASRAIVSYYTLCSQAPSALMWHVAKRDMSRRNAFLMIRRGFWNDGKGARRSS